jgi:hypothetical protein
MIWHELERRTEALIIVQDYGMMFPVPLLGRLRYGRYGCMYEYYLSAGIPKAGNNNNCEAADMLQPKAGRYFQPQAKACRLCELRRYILYCVCR